MLRRKMAITALVLLIAVMLVCWLIESRQEVVHNNLWDGSVWQVKLFLQDNWKDVGPRPPIEWGKVEKTLDGDFLVPCTLHTKVDGKPGAIEAVFKFDSDGRYIDVKTMIKPSELVELPSLT